MKNKVIAILVPLAFSLALAGSASAESGKVHKIRAKMSGCLESGVTPDSFVLDVHKGYTRHNQTGRDPFMLARTENIALIPATDQDLKKHVGQRVKVSGYFTRESSAAVAVPETTNSYTQGTAAVPVASTEFKVRKIRKIGGSCP